MSSLGLLALSAVVHGGCFEDLQRYGFEPEDLATSQEKVLYDLLKDYHEDPVTRGGTPSEDFLKAHFPEITLPNTGGTPLKDLVGSLRQTRVVREARALLEAGRAITVNSYNPSVVLQLTDLHERLGQIISFGHTATDSNLDEGMDEALSNYERMSQGLLYHHPWPWPELSQWSPGMEDTDFTVIYGRPKNKKSFLVLYFVVQAFLSGGRVLVYSKEMPREQIWRRILGFMANLPYDDLRLTRLGPDEYAQMYDAVSKVKARRSAGQGDIICVSGMDAPKGSDSVGWLTSKVRNYKPTLVVVDGMYLMAGPKVKDDHERVRSISRDLRAMALNLRVPVVATIQANRKKSNQQAVEADSDLDDVAFSDALSQDATTLMRIVADKAYPVATIVISGGREWNLQGFRIHAVPCSNFSFLAPIGSDEVKAAKALDDNQAGEDEAEASQLNPIPTRKKRRGKSAADPLEDRLLKELGDV